ncbi:GntR family transcriptional regulator [Undibacterium sp.]|jgi:DNA-binding GntR family transcriptional regulator|uniref:GntR family transcriptional regulator n=1 Tax=Undibacterium sp. TaxID=1914977 RepID=UPI002BC6AE98|nr:GntR family transcriptional regulator [Undibacterium sp.]HTD03104.1 GntR family transcriptional regulator [Undibacterium sp.]
MTTSSPDIQRASEAGISAAGRVYHHLRQRIVDMTMLPGARVVERDIAEELGTSRTPVHEAVQRLAEEGLIEVVPRVGTFVARIPLDNLEEAMLVRSALELAIIEKATERATPDGIARLQAILDAQTACIRANDKHGFHQTDEDFHAALAELSGFPGVWQIILQAKTQIDRYRQLTLPLAGRMDGVLVEHSAVIAAIASGDPANAVAAMRSHLDHVLPMLEVTRKMRPEYFITHAKPKIRNF